MLISGDLKEISISCHWGWSLSDLHSLGIKEVILSTVGYTLKRTPMESQKNNFSYRE
jgi:hypothetical protein